MVTHSSILTWKIPWTEETLTDTDSPVRLKPCEITREGENRTKIILTEGKTHEVRRIMAHFGKEVISLRRIGIASLFLEESSVPGVE